MTKLITVNDTVQFRFQCLNCGSVIGKSSIPHATLSQAERDNAVDFDKEKSRQYWERRSDEIQAERRSLDAAWWAKYDTYLKTPDWRAKRDRVMRKYHGICQGCLESRATMIHHLTYAHVFDELLFELIPVCNECHKKLHPDADFAPSHF